MIIEKKIILSSPSTDFTAVEGQNQIKMFYFVFESAVSVQKHEFFVQKAGKNIKNLRETNPNLKSER